MIKIKAITTKGMGIQITESLDKKIYSCALKYKKNKLFPSYISGASYHLKYQIACSGDINKSDFVEYFKNEIELKFGPLGTKLESSSVGYCAEIVAFNRLLKRYNKRKSISVGIAIRPKTMQIGDRCLICTNLF